MTNKDKNMPDDELAALLKRYTQGNCTEGERRLAEMWFEKHTAKQQPAAMKAEGKEALYGNILQQLQDKGEMPNESHKIRGLSAKTLAVAASIIVLLGIVTITWLKNPPGKDNIATAKTSSNDLLPGSNKATLTLANGSVIALNTVKTGAVVKQGGVKIIKVDDGQLRYSADADANVSPQLNTIRTQAGGQYMVVLPDGSQVWLNSGSSLTFPEAFKGAERNVTLTGEAYFEVAKNKAMPFKVKVNNITVQVLGTHFNIMAYGNEPAVKTTLLEGSVKISTAKSSALLKPNEFASVVAGTDNLRIASADAEKEVAWKNNLFWFDGVNIKTVMNQLARWYDVDIKYEGNCTKLFTGTIPKNMNASKVLKVLEQTGGVHFRIDGKAITVLP